MSGPKHLWSGDWEDESARSAEELANVPAPLPEPEPPAPAPAGIRLSRRQLVISLTAGVAAAAIAVVLVTTLGGPARRHSPKLAAAPSAQLQTTTPRSPGGQSCQQNPQACGQVPVPVVTGPTADWLGMQIVTSPSGVVISTVRLNSPADQAGFEPGDQIEAINGHQISSVPQIRTATAKLRIGASVGIEVLRSSSMVDLASVPMSERPTIHP